MRAGLRLQILLLLGGLLLLSFAPLYAAVATYTTVALYRLRVGHARALGRAIASHVSEARTVRSAEQLQALLAAELGSEGVEALAVYDAAGEPLLRAGEPAGRAELGARVDVAHEASRELDTAAGRKLLVVVPGPGGAVAALLRLEDRAQVPSLLPLLALYTLLVALALLVIAYFALTRLIVRPLDELSRAAERVASGARRLTVPATRVRELSEFGQSLQTMTEKLISEEEALRRKVDEVQAATHSLRLAQERLVRSERLASVGRLAAGLAHEIGNPIAALIGLQDLMLSGDLAPGEQRDFLERMRRETERIHGILRDLLEFARPAAGPRGVPEPGDVSAAVSDTAALVAPQKAMKDVELSVELAPDLPLVALSRAQLVQVVLNLVLNAADAVHEGGRVRVTARRSARGVELAVQDDGPGVAAEVRDRLFEPFVTTKEVGKGTGLGLAVCRGLVEAVGGSIALDEAAARGARFVVELPRATTEAPGPPS